MTQVIWTKHLHQRIKERGINSRDLDKTIRFPDKILTSKNTGSKKHVKDIHGQQITATIKRQENDWIVTSVWQKPSRRQQASKTHIPWYKKLFGNLPFQGK